MHATRPMASQFLNDSSCAAMTGDRRRTKDGEREGERKAVDFERLTFLVAELLGPRTLSCKASSIAMYRAGRPFRTGK